MAKRIPLDSVCEKKISTLPSQYEGKINYVDISSIENETKQIISTQCLSAKEAPSRAKQLLEVDDILVSTVRPNLNAVAMVRQQAENLLVGSTGYCVLRCNDKVDKRYVFFFCQSPYFVDDMTSQATGASYPAVSSGIVKNSTIPFCPIEEQVAIADIFDKLSQLIILRKQQLAKLDEFVKARFVELFGDPQTNPNGYGQVKLSEVASYFNGLTYKPENVSDTGTIVLRSSNIQNNQLDFSDTVRVDCTVKERFMVQENDILMCSRNGSAKLVGKVALIKGIQEPMSFGAFMMIIRSRYYSYLMTYFQLDAFRQQIKTGATTTINQITGRILDDVTLPVPPIALVEQFTAFVEQTDKSKLAIQQSLDKLEILKKALMQKYFG
jgi:type I restriction enzyme S subunit